MSENEYAGSEEKKAFRKQMMAIRDSLSEEERNEKSHKIHASFLELFEDSVFGSGREESLILLYASTRSEVDTFGLWKEIERRASEKGKNVRIAFPKVLGPRWMEFYLVSSGEDLIPAFRGIKEPVEKNPVTEEMLSEKTSILVVPGVAFDEQKNRMGYGGGFYDTYLERFGKYFDRTAALAFEAQISKTLLPTESHDRKPDVVITEERVLR